MPLYEYYCVNCRAHFEALRPMSQFDTPIACPHCADLGTRRMISTFAAISRGDGGSHLVASSQSSVGCGGCTGSHCATCGH